MKMLDVAIIGGGPAGMAAAVRLKKMGIDNVMLFERNSYLGGILIQCIHPGFGLIKFKEELSGPEFALRYIEKMEELKVPYRIESMVIDVKKDEITVSSKKYGLEIFKIKSVIFATGCRERTRENLQISGTRPAGIYGAGLAQTLVNIYNLRIGNKVVIQGSGDIGLIMARRLIIEGYKVTAVFERLPYLSGLIRNKVQCLDHFNIPLFLSTEITEICGKDRVKGIYVKSLIDDSKPPEYIECDTVLFSVGLIPELELPRKAGVKINNNFNPDINSKFESSIDGLFFCGNCMHINDLADTAAIEGERAAEAVFEYLGNKQKYSNTITSDLPYKEVDRNIDYNDYFFEQLKRSGEKVCIICPKSCRLSERKYGCKMGFQYFESSKKCNKQRMATMSFGSYRNPIISESDIPVKYFTKARKLLKIDSAVIDNDHISIKIENNNYIFRKSKIFSKDF